MTDCALAAPSTTSLDPAARRARRTLPRGVPRWAWLFGVTVVPLEQKDPMAPRAWVVSGGAGTTYTAALFHDGPSTTAADH
jgi:hypothetical protein